MLSAVLYSVGDSILAVLEPRPSIVRNRRSSPARTGTRYLRAWRYTGPGEKPLALLESVIPRGVDNPRGVNVSLLLAVLIPRGVEHIRAWRVGG